MRTRHIFQKTSVVRHDVIHLTVERLEQRGMAADATTNREDCRVDDALQIHKHTIKQLSIGIQSALHGGDFGRAPVLQ